MSSSESEQLDSDISDLSDDFEEDFEVEGVRHEGEQGALSELVVDISRLAYSEEPLADEDWIREYNQREKEAQELEEQLLKRMNGTSAKNEWCKCGNCDASLAQNFSETYCCHEFEQCIDSLRDDEVLQDAGVEELNCVTEHPGFQQVCIQKWSLRLAADKYRKRNKESYKKGDSSEESFLRSVAYREFIRLIYGYLGKNKRYLLPSCAYIKIRETFKSKDDDQHVGFELESKSGD